jgi:2-keto-4-pentenoate hydratase/2-oxohepta-3-ene-1,7-dioic acid hydratase in catechol pathway
MTLAPGDILSTGTPAKTEAARNMPPFMKPGDRVCVSIEKIGQLANPVVAAA